MEWVETTGKTVEEAKDAALDQLGVDEQDAEFEVVEEPRTGSVRPHAGRGAGAGPGPAHPAATQGRTPRPPGPIRAVPAARTTRRKQSSGGERAPRPPKATAATAVAERARARGGD